MEVVVLPFGLADLDAGLARAGSGECGFNFGTRILVILSDAMQRTLPPVTGEATECTRGDNRLLFPLVKQLRHSCLYLMEAERDSSDIWRKRGHGHDGCSWSTSVSADLCLEELKFF